MTTEKLLREYVREILKEDDGGVYGDLGGADAAMSPYGVSFGSNDELYKVFVKPFVDVVDTAAGKSKELSQRAQTLAHVAFETIATTLIPVLQDSYKEIFETEKENLEKIKAQYKDVYASNWDAFRDSDVFCTAFCYSPVAILTLKMAHKSPKVVAGLLSVLTGGTLDPWLNKVKKKFDLAPPKTGLNFHGTGPGHPMESVIREAQDNSDTLAKVLTNPKVIKKVQQSPVVQKMEQEGKAMVRATLQSVFTQAVGVMKATNLQDLQHKTGAKLKGLEKFEQEAGDDKQKAEQALLQGTKRSMKDFYVQNLEGQVKQALAAGVEENSPFVQDYKRTIQKIKAL